MPFLALLLFLIAIFLLWLASRQKRASGLPGGRIIYSDTRHWGPVEDPLYDPMLGLTGKPDYLIQKDDQIIPVEVKSSRIQSGPYDTHIHQLAAYCLLVERVYGVRPTHGILVYDHPSTPRRTYAIDYTHELEIATLEILETIRKSARRKELARSHETPARCAPCGYRSICDQRLA